MNNIILLLHYHPLLEREHKNNNKIYYWNLLYFSLRLLKYNESHSSSTHIYQTWKGAWKGGAPNYILFQETMSLSNQVLLLYFLFPVLFFYLKFYWYVWEGNQKRVRRIIHASRQQLFLSHADVVFQEQLAGSRQGANTGDPKIFLTNSWACTLFRSM